MDEPGLDPVEHIRALRGLQRINKVTNATRALWREIKRCETSDGEPLRVLDLACGRGDVLIEIARRAKRDGVPVQLAGWDLSPTAIDQTRELATQHGFEVETTVANVLIDELPGDFDVIYCSLFLHHLSNADAELFLRRAAAATKGVVLVSDLVRSRFGYWLAWFGTRLLSGSKIVHIDGPLSVEAALTILEVEQLAVQSGLTDADITRFWPQRFLLRWSVENRDGLPND